MKLMRLLDRLFRLFGDRGPGSSPRLGSVFRRYSRPEGGAPRWLFESPSPTSSWTQ